MKLFGGKLPGKATPDASQTALRACVAFCLEPETFPVFAEWARKQSPDSIFHCEDPDRLRDDVVAGDLVVRAVQQLMPVMGRMLASGGEDG